MRPLQAHCHRGLGTLYATIGQREQARAELSTAIEMYQSMEMTFWLPQAETTLAQMTERWAVGGPADLTVRLFAQLRHQDTWRDMIPTQLIIIRVEREEEEKSPTQGMYGEKFR
jgi:hypothetical protein